MWLLVATSRQLQPDTVGLLGLLSQKGLPKDSVSVLEAILKLLAICR